MRILLRPVTRMRLDASLRAQIARKLDFRHSQQHGQPHGARLYSSSSGTGGRSSSNSGRIQWRPIPLSLGLLVIAAVWYRRRVIDYKDSNPDSSSPRVRPTGPWQVYVLETLPLRSISRLWGRFNEIDLPIFMRSPGYKLYAWIFGCDLSEMKEKDLTKYRNLADFFYRELEDGVRHVDDKALIVSPADGKVLHFGKVQGREVEQVKGLTYSLDALLGGLASEDPQSISFDHPAAEEEAQHRAQTEGDFADINGITYSLDDLMSGKRDQEQNNRGPSATSRGQVQDASDNADGASSSSGEKRTEHSWAEEVELAFEMGGGRATPQQEAQELRDGNGLFFAVVYLAPGDYHRFHSPTNWVVERRRHFAGELFSVSPYIARRLANLFVLNERVVLFGRYRHGFFSMIPVGATNVGSIKIAFDRDLKTNALTKDKPESGFVEATYRNASRLLGGQPLKAGEEMGGFSLGSTIVLVFEAPLDFKFKIHEGEKVKVGQAIGTVGDD